MAFQRELLSTMYTDADHRTWAALYARQNSLVADHACQLFLDGLPRLNLDPERIPHPEAITSLLKRRSGWTLDEVQDEQSHAPSRFKQIADYRFPVTQHLRAYDSLDYYPHPDLFHEYYGHLPFFVDHYFADTAQMFGPLYLVADKRQRQEISRLWWFTIEFGLVEEDGRLKAFGAGLLSSPGELKHALRPSTPKAPFAIPRVVKTPPVTNDYHSIYFVLEDDGHVRRILQDYARLEGLPVPQTAL